MFAYEECIESHRPELIDLCPAFNTAFTNLDDAIGNAFGESQRSIDRDSKGVQISVVDTDDRGFGFEGVIEFGVVVNFDERGHAERLREASIRAQLILSKNRGDQQNGVGAMRSGFDYVVFADCEILAKSGHFHG